MQYDTGFLQFYTAKLKMTGTYNVDNYVEIGDYS